MDTEALSLLRFEAFTLDRRRRELTQDGRPVALRPKSFDVLAFLVTHAGRVVMKDEIIEAVWADLVVTDESLTRCVSDIRQALGDGAQGLIKTVPRRGYQFTAAVSPVAFPALMVPVMPPSAQTVAGPPTKRRRAGMLLWAALPAAVIAGALWFALQPDETASTARPRVAVLPFVDFEPAPADELLVDGITDDITANLSRFRDLFVTAPRSASIYKDKKAAPREIGRELGVDYLLSGHIRMQADQLRITAELVDARSGRQLWAQTYAGSRTDLFRLQDDLTQRVVNALNTRITQLELDRTFRKHPERLDAYELTLRAKALLKKLPTEARGAQLHRARALLERAIALDATYASAVVALANTYLWAWLEPSPGHAITSEFGRPATLERARSLAQRAVELDGTLAEARATLGWILFWLHGPKEGISEFERAFEFNPSFVDERFGLLLSHGGRAEEAIDYMQRAMRLDPYYPPRFTYLLGKAYFFTGRYDEAIPLIRRAATQMPEHRPSKAMYAALAAHMDLKIEMAAAARDVLRIHPEFTITSWMRFMKISHADYATRLESGLRKAGLPE